VNYILDQYKMQNNIFVDLSISKQRLSEYLGIPRPSLSRELMNMKNDGLIDYDRNIVKIIDLEGLENILTQ
ncbi:MAG TPA: helix-turn-helix domain-containing protein, partial [Peptostreptococcaceae bacterium]|nr:helix-turn-helix domain-containing protein [Peptostreptococcaceae bacterium]